LDPGSLTQTFPPESTTQSWGKVGPSAYSENGPFEEPKIGVVTGVTTCVETMAELGRAPRTVGLPPDGTDVTEGKTSVALVGLFNTATDPFPTDEDCSAIQGCCVRGFRIMPLGSAPKEGSCHSSIVEAARKTPT